MDIIPFFYMVLFVCWLITYTYNGGNHFYKIVLISINFLSTVHAFYLVYSLWQWASFIKQFFKEQQQFNWDLIITVPILQTVGICVLPLLFLIPIFRVNKYLSISMWIFISWCYYPKTAFYFFSFHKIALCISIFIAIIATIVLFDLSKKRI